MGQFDKSNSKLAHAFLDQLDNLRDIYLEIADGNGIGEDVARLFRIGEWHRIKCLDRLEDGGEYLSKEDEKLLREEYKLNFLQHGTACLDGDRVIQIHEWTEAGVNERLIAFGFFTFCYGIAGRGSEEELMYLFRLACENLGYLHGSSDAGSKEEIEKAVRSTIGKNRADALHSAPGGSREKRAKIQKIWASGKYSNRDLCAEQECAVLEMSFSTARKALRGLPDPT